MRKIPTLFLRNDEDRRHVTSQVNPECQWVIDGEGTATRKFDGTCTLLDDNGRWWFRREVKPGKSEPATYWKISTDPVTGKTIGWEPAQQSAFYNFLVECLEQPDPATIPGTYELCGPKINGNPEGFGFHALVNHDTATSFEFYGEAEPPRDFESLRNWLLVHEYEGIVWHHEDGRRAKLKCKDFA